MKIAITGTTSGIGKALKNALSSEHEIVCLDRTLFDLTKIEDLEKINLSGVDILVNNAGHFLVKPIMDTAESELKSLLDVHVIATLLCTQAAVPLMQKHKYGRIINIVSSMGQGASEFTSHYQAAKAAQHSLTKSSAISFRKDGITANSVSPTTIDTELFHSNDANYKKYLGHASADELEKRQTSTPKGLVSAEDVARVVSFLASPESANITGEVIGI